MKKLNPIEKSRYITNRYKEYLKSSFNFGEGRLQNLFLEELEKENLFKGPYVDMNFPFQRGKNIKSLIDEGIICESFRKLNDINFTRPLYSHQEEAIRIIGKGHSAVITTGTGSGKTESFLYPILNDLLFDVEKGNKEVGIRAIFLYPMNALVNDQIERIRNILSTCPEITFGFFTGETPEKATSNTRKKLGEENKTVIPDNELVSREEIRNNPPHLLFTNYSMLEYLLIRPNDYSLFEEDRLKNWKFVILDEAHTYNGSLGIEISLLLRRLTGLAQKRPRFILTSATLGQQGKSEGDIIKFANNLTSADFEVNDIIFSKRIDLKGQGLYRVLGSDYIALKNNLESLDIIQQITNKYYSCQSSDIREVLYELLSKDINVHELCELLRNGAKEFRSLYQKFKEFILEEELIALIDIINNAEKNGIGLFDLKYHSFVRPLSGAYITYGKEPKLTLTKTNEIDGMKAFEIGNCRFCNSIYIIGKIKKRESDGLSYLLQNKEVDIYENYGNDQFVRLDYFLLENVISEDESEKEQLEEYSICAKCGEIHEPSNLNAKGCNCGDDYRFIAYLVPHGNKKDEFSIYNNITQCPCCGHKGKMGVVKALNIGKDEGTALIAQTLYEAIDEDEQEPISVKKISLKSLDNPSKKLPEKKTKQFLAFSDSRQQASFAAVFFDSNHVRMLRKRLIWEIIVKNQFKAMNVDELASYLTEEIKTKDLFQNDMNSHKNAWAAIMVDLLKVDGSYDGEALGLYYFDLDIQPIIDLLDYEEIEDLFSELGCNMNKDELNTLMQIVLSVFKITPAISYAKSTLTPEEKENFLGYRQFNNYVIEKGSQGKRGTRSFLPINKNDNGQVRFVKKVFDCSSGNAIKILQYIFTILVQGNEYCKSDPLLVKHDKEDSYQINVSRYIVKNYKTSKFYRCNKCGRLTPYNLRGKCPQDNCSGTLIETDPDKVLSNNFYRKQYKEKKIECIVIQEHTAQLNRKQARDYQVDFKNKKINILSCSTTFEMGIDIGGLETIFMRNVPPTPANYVQRAGRAGRRKDSAAYILTYCGTGSHDYTYFSEPERMISGVINPPYFNVLNKKIIVRHLMAASLGYYFRLYPEVFSNLDAFIFNGGVERFNEYIQSHPDDLNQYINQKILPEEQYENYKDFKWIEQMGGEDEKLSNFSDTIWQIMDEYEEAKKQAIADDRGADSDYYKGQIEALKKENVLEYLSKYCVIPKYGFPVDVVDLQIYEKGVPQNNYAMSRDLKVAISEYAPDSEVIVDKKKYTSKYITLKRNSEFTKNWFVKCRHCEKINIFVSRNERAKCKYCGQEISTEINEYYIEPRNGFKTGEGKESLHLKPKRSSAGEVIYLGGGKPDDKKLAIGNCMFIETSSEDRMLIMNKSSFYLCPTCGYSEIGNAIGKFSAPQNKEKHKNFKQYSCSCDTLEKVHLGHKFETDVTRFTIPMLYSNEKTGYSEALTFLYAFLEGVSIALGIERFDINGVVEVNFEMNSFDVLLYDDVPGGAGHVKRLLSKEAVVRSLQEGLNKVSKDCCDENTSCYNCLRNYYNQPYHGLLVRKFAIDKIKQLLLAIEKSTESFRNNNSGWLNQQKALNSEMQLILGTDGRNPGTEIASEIWSDLLDDCFDDNEVSLITQLKNNSPEMIAAPYYRKTVKIKETGEEFITSLIWYDKKVILFLNDVHNDYLLSIKTGWDVYSTKQGFDAMELLSKVGK